MSAAVQEWIASGIVAIAGIAAAIHVYRRYLAYPLAEWLLKSGKVKLAMKINPRFRRNPAASSPSDDDCCS